MKNRWIVSACLLAVMATGCAAAKTAEPTLDHELIKTQAVQTVMAQITQDASDLATKNAPTATAEMTATPSLTPTPAISNTPAPCADAAWVKDISIPDGASMKPGETFTKTWKIKNTGSCTWNTDFYLIFGYGEKMDGIDTALGSTVEPGQEVEISVTLTAPSKTGDYYSWWRLKNEWGVPFGEFFGVSIKVQ